ncbi:hypothetical protein DFH11DRAFT_634741 [Phellopilus nigrolimitatus]|nr:hypothetical protein DFH11DRAFT_634741 [Phellopilus nigrolimitatus]
MAWNLDLWRPKGIRLAVSVLCWVLFVHLAGMYLFTRGFLLTRMALPDISSCLEQGSCTLPATHQRLVLLVVDALRFDFVSLDPPSPVSPFHHDVLTLPKELTARDPSRSLLYNSFSDPPTTTLQRIKGITTGSLPTFVDVGSSFGGSSIEEDSIIHQLNKAGKRVAFMGDDTWMTVFPTFFSPNMTYPYDSFNVEDLHTVDEGVIRHLFPLLEDKSRSWDTIVGHFLGVDHVGHRVGPDHPTMKTKLLQMDNVLRRVVDLLEDDTLLVVLGDHGMDRKGDHGGDDILETSAALWIYSKGAPLSDSERAKSIPSTLLSKETYPGSSVAHRWIQQIDIVPTLSLLLGLPIPFNNLGSVIPEVFARATTGGKSVLDSAISINSAQVKRYLNAYRTSASGSELDTLWPSIEAAWASVTATKDDSAYASSHFVYTRFALQACRSLWAQFNIGQMGIGLSVLILSVIAVGVLYSRLSNVTDWEKWASKRVGKIVRNAGVGAVLSPPVYLALGRFLPGVGLVDLTLMVSSFASCLDLLLEAAPNFSLQSINSVPIILVLHSLIFLSNSFTFWEDRIVPFLLITSIVPAIRVGLCAPETRMRRRILLFSAVFAFCVRLMALSTVCREEQQPYCHVTFYASSSVSSPPPVVLFFSLPVSLVLPLVIRRFLAISASDKGLVPSFLTFVLRPALVASSVCWIFEWLETSEILGAGNTPLLRIARTILAQGTFGGLLLGGTVLWWRHTLCVDIRVTKTEAGEGTKDTKPKTLVVLNTNSYGSPFLLFWSICFALVYLTTQLTGQIVLGLAAIALLAHLEVCDSVRDVQALNKVFASSKLSAALDLENAVRTPFTFAQTVPLALLGLHTFYATGHQATISSLQWKSAFLLTPTLSYPASRVSVILNTFGPQAVFAIAAPLLACWQLAPAPGAASRSEALGGSVRAGVGLMLYNSVLLLSSAASSAWLRRHLMVWKVFAPRFMSAAASLMFVDFAVILAVGVGVHRASSRISKLIENMEQSKKDKIKQ